MKGDFQTADAQTAQAQADARASARTTAQTADQVRERVREQVRAELQRAQEQVQAARSEIDAARQTTVRIQTDVPPVPAIAPVPPVPPSGQGDFEFIGVPPQSVQDVPPRAQELAMLFFVTIAFVIIGLPIARAISRWIDRRANAPAIRTADVEPHLVRIEQAVEAMAIEVERISEAQRYLTKLQTGSHADPLLVPRQGD